VLVPLFLLVAGQPQEQEVEARLVDMVVAQVDSTVITLSEVTAEARLLLLRTRGLELARSGLVGRPLMLSLLRSMVHRELILGEVRRLNLQVPEEEVERSLAAVRRKFPTPEDYQRFMDLTGFRDPVSGQTPLLSAVIRSELQAERYLDLRVRLNVVIPESDLLRCYEANESKFFGRAFAEMKPRIQLVLQDQREQRVLADLLEQLETRAKIRYSPGFDPGPPDTAPTSVAFQCPE
jgi:hypothetical protein